MFDQYIASMMFKASIFFVCLLHIASSEENHSGFVSYCPCMGRFGNQADNFLGALAFAKSLNRTLILPPWVEYRYGEAKSIQMPFNTYFQTHQLFQYHRVILMEKFMQELAPTLWPPEERTSFCYLARQGDNSNSCNAKDGNPFGPFWDTFNIDFVKSEFYGPLTYDAHNKENVKKWMESYPHTKFPVLAFTGAPGSFPVQDENRHLHQYLKWTDEYYNKARAFIRENMFGGSFIGIHLRNGADWVRACQHLSETPLLFSAPQCVGYKNERGAVTQAMCMPSKQDIIRRIKRALKHVKDVKFIFVASDANHMIEELQTAFHRMDLKIVKLPTSNPHLDLAVLGQSNFFIGNCISSFSAFVKRERDSGALPSGFWAFPTEKMRKHDEL